MYKTGPVIVAIRRQTTAPSLPHASARPAWHTMNELLPLVLWLGLALAIGAASTGAVAFVLTCDRRSLPCGAADREITSRACPVRP